MTGRGVVRSNMHLDLPKIRPVTSSGGGWTLGLDGCENWAWNSGIFTNSELDAIVAMGVNSELERGVTFGANDVAIRDSFVQFLYPNEITNWLFDRIAGIVMAMNERYFHFDLSSLEQGLQFTRYQAPSEHYEWHVDRAPHSPCRKLSMSLQLSDPNDYSGGDLELWFGGEPSIAPRERGALTFFPSWAMHRVTPVTEGARYSLVCWISGPPFK